MKLAIFSHCVLDTIQINNSSYQQVGGPACYCSLVAKNLKFDVDLFTKFGNDFPYDNYLTKNEINFHDAISKIPTTRFRILIDGSERTLYLEQKCEQIDYSNFNADGTLISPVFDEISSKTFEQIKKNSNFIFLDPQGFLRRINSNNEIYLEKTNLDLSNVSAIKVNLDELENLVGATDENAMKLLQKNGIEYVLFTNKRNISMLVKDRLYSITLPTKELFDTTGVGDIFSAVFCSTILKENDLLWALSFAGGAAQAALESKEIGLQKVPKKGAIETNASYFYNMIKFKQI
ncbi:MAG TPA: PfkB family carbohydrate kinase [Nitrosopumilaceae archaeon]|nr:PfkB family carbohydrate kinase [Nitrosopumilaceae archaeon]